MNQTSRLISKLEVFLQGEVKIDDIVAVVSNYPQRGLNDTYHIAKVDMIEETGCVISVLNVNKIPKFTK